MTKSCSMMKAVFWRWLTIQRLPELRSVTCFHNNAQQICRTQTGKQDLFAVCKRPLSLRCIAAFLVTMTTVPVPYAKQISSSYEFENDFLRLNCSWHPPDHLGGYDTLLTIETCRRFIEKKDIGRFRQAQGNSDALQLTTGETDDR